MADVTVAVQKLIKTNELSPSTTCEAAKSYSETNDIYVDCTGTKRIILAVTAGAASAALTVKAGTGVAGTNDLVLAPENGKVQFIELDTSSFEDLATGKIHIEATAKGGTMSAVAVL